MPAYTTFLLLIETVILLVLVGFLIYKSIKLSKILRETVDLRKNFDSQMQNEKEREDFLAMLVHELRSPLAVMKGAADLILKDAVNLSKDQIETLLEQIKNSSNGMLKIVNDILDVSKMDAGKFEVNKSFGDLNKVLHDECEYYKALAGEKSIELKCDFDGNLPSFNFDADRIRQVMNNLLSNAIKFTPDSGTVMVTTRKTQTSVKVSVLDSGEGITEGMKYKLFHKFVQLSNHTKARERGTGLGLVVCKGIVEAHGGEIWIEDNTPHGAKFVFSLPVS